MNTAQDSGIFLLGRYFYYFLKIQTLLSIEGICILLSN